MIYSVGLFFNMSINYKFFPTLSTIYIWFILLMVYQLLMGWLMPKFD